jgi:sulfoxide reductase heme-binding subunit YedZ
VRAGRRSDAGGGLAGVTLAASALWYFSRGTGAAALILLTAALALGVADVARWRSARWPRFVVDALHGTLALAAVALVAAHVVTSVLDPFAPLRLADAVLPFGSRYRPLWVGLGALASDLLVVLVVTSLLRRRIGPQVWRAVHWAAYACWPPAVAHGLGTGSDTRTGWMLAVTLGCVGAVAAAVLARCALTDGHPAMRAGGVAALGAALAALALWLPAGPLAPGWARRAGTPAALLARAVTPRTRARASVAAMPLAFDARGHGRLRSGTAADGTALVDIALRLRTRAHLTLDLRLAGRPLPGGGLSVERSQVTLGPATDPARYAGRLESLRGTTLDARVAPVRGRAIQLHAVLVLRRGGQVTATVRGVPA